MLCFAHIEDIMGYSVQQISLLCNELLGPPVVLLQGGNGMSFLIHTALGSQQGGASSQQLLVLQHHHKD